MMSSDRHRRPLVRHVLDVEPLLLLQHFHEQVVRAAASGRRKLNLPGFFFTSSMNSRMFFAANVGEVTRKKFTEPISEMGRILHGIYGRLRVDRRVMPGGGRSPPAACSRRRALDEVRAQQRSRSGTVLDDARAASAPSSRSPMARAVHRPARSAGTHAAAQRFLGKSAPAPWTRAASRSTEALGSMASSPGERKPSGRHD